MRWGVWVIFMVKGPWIEESEMKRSKSGSNIGSSKEIPGSSTYNCVTVRRN